MEKYVQELLPSAGFVDIEFHGYTSFWTSTTTRGGNFTAYKPKEAVDA
jgi:hypothetical protein